MARLNPGWTVEILLKRHFWLVNLLGLAIIAWLTAGSVNAFVGMWLTRLGRSDTKTQVVAQAGESELVQKMREGRMREESGAVVAGRSIFYLEEPVPEVEPEEAFEEVAEEPGPLVPSFEPTTLPIKLLGTMVVQPETWSSASVELERQDQKIVSPGLDLLNGQAQVVAIRRNYIVLKEGDKLTIAPLFAKEGGQQAAGAGTVAPTYTPPPRGAPSARTTAAAQEPGVEGARRISDTAWQLDRTYINDKLKDMASLGQQVRIVPNYHQGKYEGFRMIGMQGSSLFKNIGFENGDIVQAINGERIDSPNKALALYDALKNKSRLTVLVERGGVAKTLRFTVR